METNIRLQWQELEESSVLPLVLESKQVHILFGLEEAILFSFGPHYSRSLNPNKVFMIFNPEKNLEVELHVKTKVKLIYLNLELKHLHELFVPGSQQAPVFNPENSNHKFYEEKDIPSELYFVLNQLFARQMAPNAERLYRKAKAYEILSLFFSEPEASKANCPFLNNENVILKVKQAKEYLLANYNDPPQIHDLALKVGLNEFQLKSAFKEIYGNSPYQYLLDHKLNLSRTYLLSGKLQVNEVAYKMGYSNPSHYIEAFKKKYGITPKKLISK
ncbi:MAG: AraC family transcriptional regulator [Saprospiraceae bacterium]|jgi:AraC-like DNA-binding protein|nr:helix-turn-helix transcriptional regulator [Saprospiraceae bacterium]MBK7467098.1 helix-turn-helix transcriptional regulator [Saprospiraceae bacterium]MBK9994769.1 helix-turn-helix transcriptional regulator [Saprospiraceae bacterium]